MINDLDKTISKKKINLMEKQKSGIWNLSIEQIKSKSNCIKEELQCPE
jgi:hypothetical protein